MTGREDKPPVTDQEEAEHGLGPRNNGSAHQAPPHDLDAEEALLSCLLSSTNEVVAAETVTADDFYRPGHGAIFNALKSVASKGASVDVVTVAHELQERQLLDSVGGRDTLIHILGLQVVSSNAKKYADIVAALAEHRRRLGAALELAEASRRGDDQRVQLASARLATLEDRAAPNSSIPVNTLADFLSGEEEPYDWVIPDVLERGDRVLLTGPEGGGKSFLLRQIAVQAAAGIHPFTLDDITPLRVLLLDLENGKRQVKRHLRPLQISAHHKADENLAVASHPQGLDLTDAGDVAELTNLVKQTKPDLLIGGPIYKLVGGDPTEEPPAKAAASTLDRLRTDSGFALILETHQPHANNGKRPERPYGASLWLRWPEFGLHLSAEGQLREWRGPRDERQWPTMLQRGGNWPWTSVIDVKALTFGNILQALHDHGGRLTERELVTITGASKSKVHRAIDDNRTAFDAALEELGQ